MADAELALDAIRAAKPSADADLGDLYDGLAEAAAESDDYELAVRAQRRAVELGCEYPELARLRRSPNLAVDGHPTRVSSTFLSQYHTIPVALKG